MISGLLVATYFDFRWGQRESWSFPGIFAAPLLVLFAILAALELDRLTAISRYWPQRLVMIITSAAAVGLASVPAFLASSVSPGLGSATELASPGDPLTAITGDAIAGSAVTGPLILGRLGWPALGMIGGLFLAFFVEMWRFSPEAAAANSRLRIGPVTSRIGLVALAMIYIGWPLAMLMQLRLMGSNAFGIWAMLSVLVIPKVSDAGAYFVGHALGKRKLIPRLSPGKTVEGAIGGLVFGVVGSVVMWLMIAPWVFGCRLTIHPLWSVVYGLLLTVVGMAGDLAESLIKRDCESKDSSHLLPGLGGVLDVIDSILATAPAAYVFWLWTFWR